MSPDNVKGGPQATEPGNRRQNTTAATTKQHGSSVASVSGAGRDGRYPVADASHYPPVSGRDRDWLSIRCPRCGGVHLARLRPGALPDGPRRTPCGKVFVVIRGTYAPGSTPPQGAAA